jgi:hypothetical protein
MDINSPALPSEALVQQKYDEYFNKIEISPVNGDIFISDAGDFRNRGNLLIYNNTGELVSKHTVGIIPGYISFNLTIE